MSCLVFVATFFAADGCATFQDCPDGLSCVGGGCVKPKYECDFCWKSAECLPNYKCLGYDGIGGMCLPVGCSVDDDCTHGLICQYISSISDTACWVQPAGELCIGDVVWKTNSCGMAYTPFLYCSLKGNPCLDGVCCYKDCTGKHCGSDGCNGSCGLCGSGSACVDGQCSACIPGVIDYEMCDVMCSAKMRVCDPLGSWGLWSDCVDDALCQPTAVVSTSQCPTFECRPGDVFSESCGNCGEQYNVCDGQCVWEEGRCVNQGVCAPGLVQTCGENGLRRCRDSCRWGSCQFSESVEPVVLDAPTDEVLLFALNDPVLPRDITVTQGCNTSDRSGSDAVYVMLFCLLIIRTRL